MLKGKSESGKTFQSQPFFPESDAAAATPARRDMYIGNNEMEIEESDPQTGIRTNVRDFNTPNTPMHTYARTHVHTYAHTCTHMHTHTHTHTHT